jgi:hypothetical protein
MKNLFSMSFFMAMAIVMLSFSEVKGDVDLIATQTAANTSTTTFTVQVRQTSGAFNIGTSTVEFTLSNTTNVTGLNTSAKLGDFSSNSNYSIGTPTYSSGVYTITFTYVAGSPVSVGTSYEDMFSVTFNHNNSGNTNLTFGGANTTVRLENNSTVVTDGTFTGLSAVPLPVTLTKFFGKYSDNRVILNWATASEINNDKFDIERSTNGTEFVKVGEVKGRGNTNQLQDYSFVDNDIASVSANKLFYRLKQHDFNGDFEYSNITLVKKNNLNADVKVFPNPATIKVTVDLNNPDALASKIEVLGLDGKTYLTLLTERNSEDLDISHLGQGIYLIKVTGADDAQTIQKLIIQ